MVFTLGSFGTSKEALFLLTRRWMDAGIPLAMVALNKDHFDFRKSLRLFVRALEELLFSRFFIVTIWGEVTDISVWRHFLFFLVIEVTIFLTLIDICYLCLVDFSFFCLVALIREIVFLSTSAALKSSCRATKFLFCCEIASNKLSQLKLTTRLFCFRL